MTICNGTKRDGQRCTKGARKDGLRCSSHDGDQQVDCGMNGCMNGKRHDSEGCWEHPVTDNDRPSVDESSRIAAEQHVRVAKVRSRAARDLPQEDYRVYNDAVVFAERMRDKLERLQEQLDSKEADMRELRSQNTAFNENAQIDAQDKVRLNEAINAYDVEQSKLKSETQSYKSLLDQAQEQLQKVGTGGVYGDIDPEVVMMFYQDKEEELRDLEKAFNELQERLTTHGAQADNLRWQMDPAAVRRSITDMKSRRKNMTMDEFNRESLKMFKELSVKQPRQ